MPDELDLTEERMEFDRDVDIRNIQAKALQIERGEPGDCDLCGETFSRVLVREFEGREIKVCGRCRDENGLK